MYFLFLSLLALQPKAAAPSGSSTLGLNKGIASPQIVKKPVFGKPEFNKSPSKAPFAEDQNQEASSTPPQDEDKVKQTLIFDTISNRDPLSSNTDIKTLGESNGEEIKGCFRTFGIIFSVLLLVSVYSCYLIS